MNPAFQLLILFVAVGLVQAEDRSKCFSMLDACMKSGEKCPTLPLAKVALPPVIDPQGFNVTEIRKGVYTFTEGGFFAIILFANGRLTVVDFPFTPNLFNKDGDYLPSLAVAKVLNGRTPRLIDMVYGHRHMDHIAGSTAFYQYVSKSFPDVPVNVWGTMETKTFLGRAEESSIPKVTKFVKPRRARYIRLTKNLRVRLTIMGGHTQTDLLVHIVRSPDGPGIAHLTDIIRPDFVSSIWFGITPDFGRYLAVHEELLKLDFEIFSPGHGRLASKNDLRVNLAYAKAVQKAMGEAQVELVQDGYKSLGLDKALDPTASEFGNYYWWRKVHLDAHANTCARKLIKQYGCKLGGVESFAASHCEIVYIYNNVDLEPNLGGTRESLGNN